MRLAPKTVLAARPRFITWYVAPGNSMRRERDIPGAYHAKAVSSTSDLTPTAVPNCSPSMRKHLEGPIGHAPRAGPPEGSCDPSRSGILGRRSGPASSLGLWCR